MGEEGGVEGLARLWRVGRLGDLGAFDFDTDSLLVLLGEGVEEIGEGEGGEEEEEERGEVCCCGGVGRGVEGVGEGRGRESSDCPLVGLLKASVIVW